MSASGTGAVGAEPNARGAAHPGADALLAAAVAALPGAKRRAGQQAMAAAVQAAFDTGEHLLVQAGTGTGKSLAYLAGALAGTERTVVSTATLALQSQLLDVDLPRMLDAVTPLLGRRPEAAVLKGRANYLCLLRLSGDQPDPAAPTFDLPLPTGRLAAEFARLRTWAERTATGDRDELDWTPAPAAWAAASVSARDCVGAHRCPYGDGCFAEAARERARLADVVVTNHSLLALDVLSGGAVLPEHDAVVVDEAHELVDRLTAQAAQTLTDRGVRQAFARAGRDVADSVQQRLDEAADGFAASLRAVPAGRLAPVPAALARALEVLASTVADAAAQLPTRAGVEEDPAEVARRQQARSRLEGVADVARRITGLTADDVAWVERDSRGEPVLQVAPLDVSERLAAGLFARHPVAATSATLAVAGSFDPVAASFGLPTEPAAGEDALRWRGLDVGSPFDYPRQGRLYVAGHLPEPSSAGITAPVLDELAELIAAAGGRTLGLFTSRRAAEAAAGALRERLDVPVLLQGDAPLPALVRRFRAEPATCLFGTLSLWQGVDAPGSACTLVTIDRIPFYRPDEPLPQARIEAVNAAGGSGFEQVSLAHAAVLLAQGAGRLIRSAGDRGLVAVLDPRLATRRYGRLLRRSLPPLAYPTSRAAALAWLRQLDSHAPPPLPVPPERELARALAGEALAGEAAEAALAAADPTE